MPVALITGASAGIGKEFAKLYAARGYELVLVARREDSLRQLASELSTAYGVTSHVVAADLASPTSPIAIQNAVNSLGIQIDLLVNNAGFAVNGAFATVPAESHLDILQVNITSLVHLTHLFLPAMLERGNGGILNVASTAAFVPGPMMAIYYATKAFVLSFTEALANECADRGVKVSCLCPGATITEFQIRAGMENSKLFQRGFNMDAKTVAQMGVDGLDRNQTVVICGFRNKLAVASSRFVPRKMVLRMVRKLQEIPHD